MKIRMLAAAGFLGLSVILSACDSSATATPGTSGTSNTPNTPSTQNNNPPPAGGTGGKRQVVVSSKDFPEEVILGNIYSLALQSASIPVTEKMNLGGTDIAQAALI